MPSRAKRAAVQSMCIWVLVFFTRPHKVSKIFAVKAPPMFVCFFVQEERFIFPIFPLFCLNAAIAVCSLPVSVCEGEGEREGGREIGREGGREGTEGWREDGRGREGGDGGREGGWVDGGSWKEEREGERGEREKVCELERGGRWRGRGRDLIM